VPIESCFVASGEFTAMVKHPWAKQDEDELELVEGELIYVLGEPDEEGWCRGRKDDGTEGLFPADYVDLGEGVDL
jgi:protein kinase C and casein kinase substrate in neurons protein